jgi:hypothetical protein
MTNEEYDKALDALDSLYLKLPTIVASDICRIIVPMLHRLEEAEKELAYEYGIRLDPEHNVLSFDTEEEARGYAERFSGLGIELVERKTASPWELIEVLG